MSKTDSQLGKNADNTHRSLQELVSVNAWFAQDQDNPSRFTLHADVSFSEERLGGGAATQIMFKLSVKRCDIIFVLPSSAQFRVDASTVHSPKPLNPRSVIETDASKSHTGAKAKLTLSGIKSAVSGEASASYDSQRDRIIKSEQTVGLYHELWKKVRGNHAWSVDGRELEKKRLAGPVFDGANSPRLTIIDDRTDEAKAQDKSNNLDPVAEVKVRCLREDIDIYDIAYKDTERQMFFERSSHRKAKLLAAREVLKEALLREGLVAGDLASDPYAEMTICDVAITIIDSRT